jgi:hypothetical protein
MYSVIINKLFITICVCIDTKNMELLLYMNVMKVKQTIYKFRIFELPNVINSLSARVDDETLQTAEKSYSMTDSRAQIEATLKILVFIFII